MDNTDKVLLCIRSYNRPTYLINTLNNLLKCDLDKVYKIIIFDDCSNDERTIKILDRFAVMDKFHIVRTINNVGCSKSYLDLLDYIEIQIKANSNIKYICIIDNDVLLKSHFINRLFTVFLECKNAYKTDNVLLSGFRPTNTHLGQEYNMHRNFHSRSTVGGLCYYFSKNFIGTIREGWKRDDDWGVSAIIKEKDYHFCCLNKGVVNHVGAQGLHSFRETTKVTFDYDETFTSLKLCRCGFYCAKGKPFCCIKCNLSQGHGPLCNMFKGVI